MPITSYFFDFPLFRYCFRLASKIHWWLCHQKEIYNKQPNSLSLIYFENKVFSQNGEDGILEEIFKRLKIKQGYFVECGVGFGVTGLECNTRLLLERSNWSGLWIEGNGNSTSILKKYYQNSKIKILNQFLTENNLSKILEKESVTKDFDLLSIDVDGNDYTIWENLVDYSPKVVVIEYNAAFPADESWIMPYNENHQWDFSSYYGASLNAYVQLASEKGYQLVGCDSMGVNAFFVRSDLISNGLFVLNGDAKFHFMNLKHKLFLAKFLPREKRRV